MTEEKHYGTHECCGVCRRFDEFKDNIHAGLCLVTDKVKEDYQTCKKFLKREVKKEGEK